MELSDIENLGTKVAVRYGVQLKLLQSTTDGVEDLTYLLKYCKFFLQGQQRATDNTLRILVECKAPNVSVLARVWTKFNCIPTRKSSNRPQLLDRFIEKHFITALKSGFIYLYCLADFSFPFWVDRVSKRANDRARVEQT